MSTEVPAIYTRAMMCQDGVTPYVQETTEYGVPGDVCPMPAGGRNQTFLDTDKKLTAMATKAYQNRELTCKEPRHRAIFWAVRP